ncbi:hypothetical protein, partial [Methylophaga sp.]|uniref:hypothetical protein n=1 Tax=Methylophaga sp. TaxID=2024840 RepID=UPI003A8FD9DF
HRSHNGKEEYNQTHRQMSSRQSECPLPGVTKTLSMVSGVIHGITDESYPSKYHGQTVLGVARHCQK